jgi:hypothetical protein
MSKPLVSPEAPHGFDLIYGLFMPAAFQRNLVQLWNAWSEWRFTDADFAALGEPPAWPEDKLSAVVLDVSLDTVQQTFDEAWDCAISVQPNSWRWEELKSDADHLRLLPGIAHQRGLRWRVVDLADNWDQKNGIAPANVRNPRTSPSSAVLWAASYFSKWIQAMDGKTVPYVWIPGYQVTVAGFGQWSGVPNLNWYRVSRGVHLYASHGGHRNSHYAVPALRE